MAKFYLMHWYTELKWIQLDNLKKKLESKKKITIRDLPYMLRLNRRKNKTSPTSLMMWNIKTIHESEMSTYLWDLPLPWQAHF